MNEVTPVPPRRTGSVPIVFARATLREEVATQTGRPVVYELVRKEPVLVARAVRVAVPVGEPKTRLPSATLVRPVPPVETVTVPVTLAAVPEMLIPWVFVHVLVSASRVVDATVMLAEPLKETPLMVRAVSRMVAVPALPPMLSVLVDCHEF